MRWVLLALIALLALLASGCAAGKAYTVEAPWGACQLDALAEVAVNTVHTGASGYCAAQIPGVGAGVLVGFRGDVYALDIKPGETPDAAQSRALEWLDAKESPTN